MMNVGNGYLGKMAGLLIVSSPSNSSLIIAYSADTIFKMFRALSKSVPVLRSAVSMRFMATQVIISPLCVIDRPSSPWRR